MEAKSNKLLDLFCEWKLNEDIDYQADYFQGAWYGKIKLFDDNHFYGYLTTEKAENKNSIEISYMLVGVYKKDLGITLFEIPIDERVAPVMFRAAPKENGEYSGDFYNITQTNILIGFKGDSIKLEKPKFSLDGRANLLIKDAEMTSDDNYVIDSGLNYVKMSLNDSICQKILSRFDTKECIEEMLDDLIYNVYPYETGKEYEGELYKITIRQR